MEAFSGGMKTAYDLAGKLLRLVQNVKIDEVKIDLQSSILEIQEALLSANRAMMEVQDELKGAREENARLTQRLYDLERYTLKEVGPGSFVYGIKAECQGDDPDHWICPACRDQGHRSIIQYQRRDLSKATYGCSRCKAEIMVPNGVDPGHA